MTFRTLIRSHFHHFEINKYWRCACIVQDIKVKKGLRKLLAYRYIKRADSFNNASLGIQINGGTNFGSKPVFPHDICGIFITPKARLGRNVTIFHQVTIGDQYFNLSKGENVSPVIEDDTVFFEGAKITGNIIVGKGAIVLANAVVTKNVPPFAIVGGVPAKVLRLLTEEEMKAFKNRSNAWEIE